MKRSTLIRAILILGIVVLLEGLCLTGRIDKLTMQPPHKMALDLWRMLSSGSLNAAIFKTLNVVRRLLQSGQRVILPFLRLGEQAIHFIACLTQGVFGLVLWFDSAFYVRRF